MTTSAAYSPPAGHALFAGYAYPPNELGYCGPPDRAALLRAGAQMPAVARAFDGAWPYLKAIAQATGIDDPLDEAVVRSYWVGGPELAEVDGRDLVLRLRAAFAHQATGMLDDLDDGAPALAHHSFHVFVVYPWVRMLDRGRATPLRVLQACRIRWGSVTAVHDEHIEMSTSPLVVDAGQLTLAAPVTERVRWRRDGTVLARAPVVGETVAAHWDWVCGTLDDSDRSALTSATQATLDLVNSVRRAA